MTTITDEPYGRELARVRFSCRSYSSTPLTETEIMHVLEMAHYAPSACNRQPWRIMVVRPGDQAARRAVQAAYGREWIAQAPHYLIVCAVDDEAWVRPYDGKNHADIDAAILAEHICLTAACGGLGTCWVCNFDPAVLAQGINFGDGLRPVVIIPIGIPAMPAPEKTRKDLDQILIRP